ncbi:hypothetical protein B0H10DRAFT_2194026 [Mycena sp. CBHHK59/15]|nr:hypothetical protein B0H10DRAFT_2194026 [Mycena sp. CBHHK59/15]
MPRSLRYTHEYHLRRYTNDTYRCTTSLSLSFSLVSRRHYRQRISCRTYRILHARLHAAQHYRRSTISSAPSRIWTWPLSASWRRCRTEGEDGAERRRGGRTEGETHGIYRHVGVRVERLLRGALEHGLQAGQVREAEDAEAGSAGCKQTAYGGAQRKARERRKWNGMEEEKRANGLGIGLWRTHDEGLGKHALEARKAQERRNEMRGGCGGRRRRVEKLAMQRDPRWGNTLHSEHACMPPDSQARHTIDIPENKGTQTSLTAAPRPAVLAAPRAHVHIRDSPPCRRRIYPGCTPSPAHELPRLHLQAPNIPA